MKELDIAVASEFLLLAAYLIEMKSRMLLPVEEKPEEAENLEEIEKTLLERLHEYKIFKELAERLKERKEVFAKAYSRQSGEAAALDEDRDVFLTDVTLRDLVAAFQKVWKTVEAKGKVGEIVDENITVAMKIKEILEKIAENKDGVPFEALFTRLVKLEVVVTFLAILELARQRLIQIGQGEMFGSIKIFGRREPVNE
jgi:segregation and condensation protein A